MALLDFLGFKTPASLDRRALAFREAIGGLDYVIESVLAGHPLVASTEWVFTTAQTNAVLIAAPTSPLTRTHVLQLCVFLTTTAPANINARIGFAASALPAESGTGVARVLMNHEFTPGAGVIRGTGVAQVGQGASTQPMLITCDAATPGKLIVLASYFQSDIP